MSLGVTSPVAAVRVAGGTWRDDLRAVVMVWKREAIRFSRQRMRIVTSAVQPVLFLFVLGTGLSTIVLPSRATGGFDFRTFIFPGVIAMTVLFSGIFSAISIVWDREFGFLREMLVAPIRRGSLVVGKCIGGATVASVQGLIMLALAGLVGVPYAPVLMLTLVGEIVLMAVSLTAVGIVMASRMEQIESFQFVTQFVVLPMFFLSGAMFPLADLPRWLAVLTKLDPLTYAVDPMRQAVLSHVPSSSSAAARVLTAGVTWNGWRVPIGLQLGIVAAFGLLALVVSVVQFSRPE
jgi:ABC-2 type transport system permease protein